MKKLSIALVSLAAASAWAPANAADMDWRAASPPVVAPVLPLVSWTGCYIGGHVGGGSASKDWQNPSGFPDEPGDHGQADFGGFVGGGQLGCDLHFAPTWLVVGLQATFDAADLSGDVIDIQNGFDLRSRVRWFATLTGRVGFTVQPNWLLYADGGAAWVRDHYSTFDVNGVPFDTADVTRTGWTVGAGAEWMFFPNWSLFLQYQFLEFGTKSIPFNLVTGGFSETWDIKQEVQVIMAGVNFRFGWSQPKAPVITKY